MPDDPARGAPRAAPHDRLRLATPADVPAIHALIERSVRGLAPGFYDARQIESGLRYVFGPDSQLIVDGTYFVIEARGGALLACGGWSRRRATHGGDQHKGVEDPTLDPTTDPARIRAMFVDPSAARRGLGRRLYEASRDAARAAGFRALTLVGTLPGVPLYAALGFRADGPYVETLPDGVELPTVVMSRAIDDV